MQTVQTTKAPSAIGPYSQAVIRNNTLFMSGQLGFDPVTNQMPDSFADQANLVFSNIKAILEAAGYSFAHVLKVTVFLKDMDNFAELNEIYGRHFSAPYPAREAIQVARLPKDGLIEISVIAMK
ncbi:MAG: RidA family protein [Candidatus Cloacimonetes bacterium]|nr:RidA family protein [Candidatus Cloacimonadota bacterium]